MSLRVPPIRLSWQFVNPLVCRVGPVLHQSQPAAGVGSELHILQVRPIHHLLLNRHPIIYVYRILLIVSIMFDVYENIACMKFAVYLKPLLHSIINVTYGATCKSVYLKTHIRKTAAKCLACRSYGVMMTDFTTSKVHCNLMVKVLSVQYLQIVFIIYFIILYIYIIKYYIFMLY